jgi:hypothetical protein
MFEVLVTPAEAQFMAVCDTMLLILRHKRERGGKEQEGYY